MTPLKVFAQVLRLIVLTVVCGIASIALASQLGDDVSWLMVFSSVAFVEALVLWVQEFDDA